MAGTLAPWFITIFDNNGNVLSGALVYTYQPGTTTPVTTYSDSTLATPNANPVVADSAGRVRIYLDTQSYKFVVKTPAGVTLYTLDPVQAVHVNQQGVNHAFQFGGSPESPVESASYPSGATFDKCHAGTSIYNEDSGDMPAGTYALEAMLLAEGGGTVTAALVNLSDGSPNTAMVEISSTSSTGERKRSGAITFATAGAPKDYAIKVKASSGAGYCWGARLVRT